MAVAAPVGVIVHVIDEQVPAFVVVVLDRHDPENEEMSGVGASGVFVVDRSHAAVASDNAAMEERSRRRIGESLTSHDKACSRTIAELGYHSKNR